DLVAIAHLAADASRAIDPRRRVTVLAPRHLLVWGDPDALRRVLDNLLGNVRAHTPAGAPVEVSVASVNGDAVIEVKDSGPGMSPEDVTRVFERFYRADASRSRASGGVGLGLSIVAAVAEAHGGTASARSEPGAGTTFRITLPLR
ncbi:MAG: sensor histidine kinase, partial [Gaiellaceae bacterium]